MKLSVLWTYFFGTPGEAPIFADAYLQDFVWVPSDLFLSVDSDARFAWVPPPRDREVLR
jgi:hypothetical protein